MIFSSPPVALQDRLKDLNGQADSLMGSIAFDTTVVEEKRNAVNGRFAKIKSMAGGRRSKLNESHRLHQFFRDLDDEESLSEDSGSEPQDDSEYSVGKSLPATPSPSPPATPRPPRRRRKPCSPSFSDDENRPPSPKVPR